MPLDVRQERQDVSHCMQALRKLDAKNRSAVNVDAWYSAYHHSHPPLVERLAAIDSSIKKRE